MPLPHSATTVEVPGGVAHPRRRLGSLHRNSLWIMGTTALNGVLGYAYWLAAARTFHAVDVGLATALISLMTLTALVANMGIGPALVQRLPGRRTGAERSATVSAGILAGAALGASAGGLAVLVLPLASARLAGVALRPELMALFIGGTAAWTVGTVLDYACIAQRASELTTARGAVFGLAKLPLLLAVPAGALGGGTHAIFGSWVVASVLSCALVMRSAARHAHPDGGLRIAGVRAELRQLARISLGNHLTTLGNVLPAYLLPVIVVSRLSAIDNAHFAITWAIGNLFFTISSATGSSLFAEGSHDPGSLRRRTASAARLTALLLGPAMVVTLLLGRSVLGLFGAGYQGGWGLLILLTVASVPDAATNLYVPVLRVRRRLRAAAALTMGMAIVAVVGGWAVAPALGIGGVGAAWLLGQTLGTAWVAWDLRSRGWAAVPQSA